MYQEALNILKKINDLGYDGYIIGGYPRDKYLSIENYDIDICTNMLPEEIIKNFNVTKNNGYGSLIINNSFEITTYRKDKYNDSRFPFIEYVETLKEDLQRRDFTINTLCIDLNGNYIDLMNARKDLDNKIIKTIKNADESFKEDPLRIIRAIRFMIDLDFSLSEEVNEAIINNKLLLKKISQGRIKREIDKIKNKDKLYLIDEFVGDIYERKSN